MICSTALAVGLARRAASALRPAVSFQQVRFRKPNRVFKPKQDLVAKFQLAKERKAKARTYDVWNGMSPKDLARVLGR